VHTPHTTAGLIAKFSKEHLLFQCPEQVIKCPSGCGERLKRKKLEAHVDSWHGSCNSRLVRCPSNLVGWKILVVDVEKERLEAAEIAASQALDRAATATANVNSVTADMFDQADAAFDAKRGKAAADADVVAGVNDTNAPLCIVTGTWSPGDANVAPLSAASSSRPNSVGFAADGTSVNSVGAAGGTSRPNSKSQSRPGTSGAGNSTTFTTPSGAVVQVTGSGKGSLQPSRTKSGKRRRDTSKATKVPIGARTTLLSDGSIGRAAQTAVDAGSAQSIGNVGIVLKYQRHALEAKVPAPVPNATNTTIGAETDAGALAVTTTFEEDSISLINSKYKQTSKSVLIPDGVDRLYVKFADRCEWVDYWSTSMKLIPIKRVQGPAAAVGKRHPHYACQWIAWGELSAHLNFECINRSVWLSGETDKPLVGRKDPFYSSDNGRRKTATSTAGGADAVVMFSPTKSGALGEYDYFVLMCVCLCSCSTQF